jgi:sporulation protein YlmC with PRC-barrel domain
MKKSLRVGTAVALFMAAAPMAAWADGATTTDTTINATTTQTAQTVEVDAGKLIGQNVVDANGDTVGEIDSVMVDGNGKVQGVVIDVSSWLQSEKLISVPWTDLQISNENKVIATNITKESATSAETYAYVDPADKGKVFTDGTVTGAGTGAATGMTLGTPIMNGDGSINASQLVGLKVENANGDKVGEIGEVILGDSGKVQGVVVDVGGFLGVGARPVLLDWKDVKLAGSGNDVKANVNATVESLKAMPAYERAND